MTDEEKDIDDIEWEQPYKCSYCNLRVNFAFILPDVKLSGLCPDCYSKREEI